MRNRWVSIVVVAALLAISSTGTVQAGIIFDSVDNVQNPPFDNSTGNWLAQRFDVVGQNYTLNSIRLRLQNVVGSGPATLHLYSNAAGEPGSSLGSATIPNPLLTNGLNLFSFGGNSLTAGQSYWAVLTSASSAVQWTARSDGGFPFGAVSLTSGSSWASTDPFTFQMQVDASQTGAAVPEPSTFFLLGGVMAGAFACRRRRKGR